MTTGAHDNHDLRERPIGDLLKQLSQETTTLVRQELELAKAEMTEKGKKAGKGAGMFGGAGVAGLLALGALTAAAILALDQAMESWLAALIVGLVHAAVAGVLALSGRKEVQQAAPPVPEQTVETVKEDVQWAKTRTPSART
ncbi:MAG: phage holin family protein [Actinomycetota bacterium]|nr:phage holin family protein [Actinomycetota bacterium]